MFENISFKKKFIILVLLLFILGFTAYKRSFALTSDAYQTFNAAKLKLSQVSNSQGKIAVVKSEVAYLDNLIGKEAASADIVQQEMLNTFNLIGTKSELIELEEVHMAKNDYFNIYTNRLLLSGNFNELLAATYYYEKDFDFSRLVGLRFYIEKEPRTRRKILNEQLIFQNYEKIK